VRHPRAESLHPLTPLAAATALVALAYAGGWTWGAAAALALALALASWLGAGQRVAWLALSVGAPTWVLLALMDGVLAVPAEARTLSLVVVDASPAGLASATGIALRLTAAVAALGAVVTTVSPRRLARALAERGLPAWSAYLLVASLEAVPQARRRAREVLEAQRCRGLGTGGGALDRARALLPLAAPLALSLVAEAEERALALDARGFRARRRRTAMAPVADRGWERTLRAALWGAAIALLAWGVLR
jgi:energy-coupling factor transport system permease protein